MEHKPETSEEATAKLLEKIDLKFEKRVWRTYFSTKLSSRHYFVFINAAYYIALFVIIAVLLASVVKQLPNISDQPPNIQIAIEISITATFIALVSFGINLQKGIEPINVSDILLEYNSEKLKDSTSDKYPALFKALVKLKSKNPDLNLKDVLELPIAKEKVFQILYTVD